MNIPKEVRLRTVVILLSSLLVLSSVSIYYAFSASTPTSGLTDIYIEPPMMESSYIIGFYAAPSTCYLKNGTTGAITSTGTFYYCLQAAVNYLTTGGKISIRSGAYDLIAGIVIETNNIWIQGEDEALSTTIRYNATGGLGAINYVGSLGWHYLGGISNIWFHGELQNNIYGLVVVGQYSDLVFKDCLFTNFDSAVVLYGGPASLGKIWNIWFTRCLFEDNLRAAINITHTLHATLASIDRIKISECHFYDNLNSIYCDAQYVWHVTLTDNTVQSERNACINVTSGGRQWIVTDNHIFDCGIGANGTMAAIMVSGSATLYPDSWLIENNIIANHFTSAPVALNNSVWLTGTVRNFAIQNNYFYVASEGVRLSGLNLTLDPQLVIKDNVGNLNVIYTSWNMGLGAEASTANYVIYKDSSLYYMRNGTTGNVDYRSSNLTNVEKYALGNTTNGLIYLSEVQHNTSLSISATQIVAEQYQGTIKYYTDTGSSSVTDCPVSTTGNFSLSSSTSEQTIVTLTPTSIEELINFYLDMSALTQDCTIRVYVTIGGSYVEMSGMTLVVVAGTKGLVLKSMTIDTNWKIMIQSVVAEGSTRYIPYEYIVNVY